MFKRWMSALLAIAMCVSMLPTAAFAAEVEDPEASTTAVVEAAETEAVPEPETEPEQKPEPETEAAETEAPAVEAPAQTEPSAETVAAETEETEAPAETEEAETSAVLCAHGMETGVCQVCALEARIAALPSAEALAALTAGEKEALAAELEALVEAYDALSAEEQALVSNIDKLVEVYQTFQGMMVMTTEELGANPQVTLMANGQTVDEDIEVYDFSSITLDIEIRDIPKSMIQSLTYNVSYFVKGEEEQIHKDRPIDLSAITEGEDGVLRASYSYTPMKGGQLSFSADLTITDTREFHDFRGVLVLAGLQPGKVQVANYGIHTGEAGEYWLELRGTDGDLSDLESITYILYRIDTSTGGWLPMDVEPVVIYSTDHFFYTFNEPGTYGCQATLRTKSGAVWYTEDGYWNDWLGSDWMTVADDDTLGIVRADTYDIAPGGVVNFTVNVGDLDVQSVEWGIHPADGAVEAPAPVTTEEPSVTLTFPEVPGDYRITAKITTVSGQVIDSPTAVNIRIYSGAYAAPNLVLVKGIDDGNMPYNTVTMRPEILNGEPAQVVGLVRDEDGNELFRETITPDENGYYSFSYTFPKAGWYNFNAIVTDETGYETWAGWSFVVTPWGAYENGPTLSVDKFEYQGGEEVTIHANVPGADQLKDVYYVVYSRSDDEETRYDYEGDLVLTPTKGGDYHVKLVVEYCNDWYDEFGHLDFQVRSGLRPVGMECSAENGAVRIGDNVVFTVNTEGEGTADYKFILNKVMDFTPGEEKQEEYDVRTGKENTVFFTINEPGFYNVEVEMRNDEGAVYYTSWGEVKAGATLYYVSTGGGNYGVGDDIIVTTELTNDEDAYKQLRFDLLRQENDTWVEAAVSQYMSPEVYRESEHPVQMVFRAPEEGWKAGTYQAVATVEYEDGTELSNRHGWLFNVVSGSYATGLERNIEEPSWWQEITFTPTVVVPEGVDGKMTGVRYEIYHEGNLCHSEDLDNDGTVVFTPDIRGNYSVYVTLRNEKDEEMTVQNDFFVNTYSGEWPGMWSDGDRFEGLDEEITIHLGIGDENGNVDENIDRIVWYLWSETLQKNLEFENRENVLHFKPTVGGYYHVECDVFWKDGWQDHHGAADFEVLSNLYLNEVRASDVGIQTHGKVTFIADVGGEGTAEYTYALIKWNLDNGLDSQDTAHDVTIWTKTLDTNTLTCTIDDPGYYYCQITMVNGEGTTYSQRTENISVSPGPVVDYVKTDDSGVLAANDNINVLFEMSGAGEFDKLRFELIRWEDGQPVKKVEEQELSYEDYQKFTSRPVQVTFTAPEGGWESGTYSIVVWTDYLDKTSVRALYLWLVDISSGTRVTEMTTPQEYLLANDPVTFQVSTEGDGKFQSAEYEIYHYDNLYESGRIELTDEGKIPEFSFVPEWSGEYGCYLITTNELGEQASAYCEFRVMDYYADLRIANYSLNEGEALRATAVFRDEMNNLVEPEGIQYYIFTIKDLAGKEIYSTGQKESAEFTYKPEKPGTYEVYMQAKAQNRDEMDSSRNFSVGQKNVLLGLSADTTLAAAGATIKFTPSVKGQVDSYTYRIFKRDEEGRMKILYEGKPTSAASFSRKFTEPGEYGCQVEVKVKDAKFLDGCSVVIYKGLYPVDIIAKDAINQGEALKMNLKTIGTGKVTKVVYRIFRDIHQGGDLEKTIILTDGTTEASYIPRYAGTYYIVADMTNDQGQTYTVEKGMIDIRQGCYLVDVTGPDSVVVGEEAKFQVEIGSLPPESSGIRELMVHIRDNDWNKLASVNVELDDKNQFELTFANTGHHTLEIWMTNDQGARYQVYYEIEVEPTDWLVKAGWLEMITDGWWEARVNTEVNFRLNLEGEPDQVDKISYYVVWGKNTDLSQCVLQDEFTVENTKSLEYSFTPTKAGDYYVVAEVTSTSGYVSRSQWANCWVSASLAETAQVSAPNGSNGMYKVGEPITITGKYNGKSKINSYTLRVYEFKYSMEKQDQWEELVYESDSQKGATFEWTPKKAGVYYFAVEMATADGVDIHSTYYSIRVAGDDTVISSVTYDKLRVQEGDAVTAYFQYQGDTNEIVEREIRIQKRLMGDDGYLYLPDGGDTRIPGDATNLNSYTLKDLEPGFYLVGVYTKNSSGNEMSVYAMDLFQVIANDEQNKLMAGELTVKSPALTKHDLDKTYNEVKVNTSVTVAMSTQGTGTILKTSYSLFYSETPDRNNATSLDFITKDHAEAHEGKNPDPCLEYTFKPTKAGYYWIIGDVRNQDNLLTSTDYLEIKVSATSSLKMQLSEPDREDGAYSAGKEITITAKYAGTKPTGYKLTVKRDNATLADFGSADFEYDTISQTLPTFRFKPEVSGMYQFLMEITTADGVTLNSFAYVPVVGSDKHVSGITFQYDQYNVGDNVTVKFDYEGAGEITDMLIQVRDAETKDVFVSKYIDAPGADAQASYTFQASKAGTFDVLVFTHNDKAKQNMSSFGSDSVVTVMESGAHWYVPHPVPADEADETKLGTEGYLYYTCDYEGHGDELFDENKNPMTEDELDALKEEKTVYFLGGKLVIQQGEKTLEKQESWDMADGKEITLKALRTPEVSTNQEAGVTWSSSAAAVATVDAEGNVEFQKPGTVTITAKANDGSKLTAAVTFTVTYRISDGAIVASLADTTDIFEESSKNGIQVNDSVAIVVKGKASDTVVAPDYLTYTATSGAALVDAEALKDGVIKAIGTGTVKITVAIDGDPLGRKATLSVKLVAMKPDSCELIIDGNSKGALEDDGWITTPGFVEEGGSYTLYAPKSADVQTFRIAAQAKKEKLKDIEYDVALGNFTWKSSNSTIKVAEGKDGYATVTIPKNMAAGTYTITATSKANATVMTSFQVVVKDFAPKLEKSSLSLNTWMTGANVSVGVTFAEGNGCSSITLQEYKGKTYVASENLAATYMEDAGKVVFTLAAGKTELPNGTYKLRLLVDTVHQTHDMSNIDPYKAPILNLTIVVKNAEPTVTITQIKKGNLAAFDSAGELTITAKNGTEVLNVAEVKFADDENLGFALGNKDESVTDSYVVSVERVEANPAKNAKATLEITVKGYSKTIVKSFTIGTTNTAASLTMNSYLEDASVYVDLPSELAGKTPDSVKDSYAKAGLAVDVAGDQLRIYPEDEEATLPTATHTLTIQIGGVTRTVKVAVKNVAPKVTVSQTKKINLADEDSYALLNVAASDGNGVQEVTGVELAANATAFDFDVGDLRTDNDGMWKIEKTSEGSGKANKAKLTISVDGYRYQTVKTLNIGTENIADKVVLDKPKVTMYLGVTDMSETVKVSTYHLSSDMDLSNCGVTAKSTTKTAAEYDKLAVEIINNQEISVSFADSDSLPKAATYKYSVDSQIAGVKPVELQVVVAKGLPKVTLKTTTAKFSTADFGEREFSLAVTAPEAGGYKLSRFEVPEEYEGKILAEYDKKLQAMVISLAEDCGLAVKTHTVKLIPVYEDESGNEMNLAEVTLKITVTK